MTKIMITQTDNVGVEEIPVPRGMDAMDICKSVISYFTKLQLHTIRMYIADDSVDPQRLEHYKYFQDDYFKKGDAGTFEEVDIQELADEAHPETIKNKKAMLEGLAQHNTAMNKEEYRPIIEEVRSTLLGPDGLPIKYN